MPKKEYALRKASLYNSFYKSKFPHFKDDDKALLERIRVFLTNLETDFNKSKYTFTIETFQQLTNLSNQITDIHDDLRSNKKIGI